MINKVLIHGLDDVEHVNQVLLFKLEESQIILD